MAKKSTKPKTEDEQSTVNKSTEEQNAPQAIAQPTEGQNAPQTVAQPTEEQGVLQTTEQTDEKQNSVQKPVKLVVISAQGLNLRAKPSMEDTALAALTAGTTLTRRTVAEAEPDGWFAVQTKDGKEGFVDAKFVAVVE